MRFEVHTLPGIKLPFELYLVPFHLRNVCIVYTNQASIAI